MLQFKRIKQKAKKLQINLAEKVVQPHLTAITKLNTEKQLFEKGVGVDGKKLEPPYARSTRRIKAKKGLPVNRVTLFDTGELHQSFKATAMQTAIVVEGFRTSAGFDVAQHLRKKYGQYEGLTEESLEAIRKIIRQEMQKHFRESLLQ